jgi:very-short-patch-repair endonuclease
MNETPDVPEQARSDEVPATGEVGGIESALERVRKKLLDLSARNRLLNFRHPRRSSVRFVGAALNDVYTALLEGKDIELIAIREPTQVEIARHLPDWDRVDPPPAERWATVIGLDTSFELPTKSKGNEPKPALQTLLYARDFDAVLRNVRSAARTAIEESGVNMLFLALGFIEWVDEQSNNPPYHAPLLLVPLVLERRALDSTTGAQKYRISYSGEDIVANLSLREKLRGSLELPDVAEDTTPASYIEAVTAQLGIDGKWRAHSWASMSLFHFGKLLMYLDLDPARWPRKRLSEHPVVKRLFGQRESSAEREAFATEHAIDELKNLEDTAPLVDNADSSQHSALIDAMDGQDLVIEGPPGTGKSQTITNLIAGAIFQGRSVLFVSEKLAALEVVRRRLNECGLGDFCLELHSHKTQKQALLRDLETRYNKRGKWQSPSQFQRKIEQLTDRRDRLKEYAELANMKVTGSDLTVHEILCGATYYRSACKEVGITEEEIGTETSGRLDSIERERLESAIASMETALERVSSGLDKVEEHPWSWVQNADLNSHEVRSICTVVGAVAEAASAAAEGASRLGNWMEDDIETLEGLVASVQSAGDVIRSVSLEAPFDVLARIHKGGHHETIVKLVDLLAKYSEHRSHATSVISLNRPLWHDASAAIVATDGLDEMQLGPLTASQLRATGHELGQLVSNGIASTQFWPDCAPGVSKGELSAKACETRQAVLIAASVTPFAALRLRSALLDPACQSVLDRFAPMVQRQREIKTSLGQMTDPNTTLTPVELRRASVDVVGGIIGWMRPSWWRARAKAKNVLLDFGRLTAEQRQKRLSGLADYIEGEQRVEADAEARSVLGEHFAGAETDIDGLRQLSEWRGRTAADLAGRPDVAATLFGLASGELEEIKRAADAGGKDLVESLVAVWVHLERLVPNAVLRLEELSGIEGELQRLQETIDKVAGFLDATVDPMNCTVARLRMALGHAIRTNELADGLNGEAAFPAALGDAWRGVETSSELLTKVAELAKQLRGLSVGLQERLLVGGSRVWNEFKQDQAQASSRLDKLRSTREQLGKHTSGLPTQELAEQEAACLRAIESRDTLVEWVDYLRLRAELINGGLRWLVNLLERDVGRVGHGRDVYRASAYGDLATRLLQEYEVLRLFSGIRHTRLQDEFRRLDEEVTELQRQRIAAKADGRPVPQGESGTRVGDYTDLVLLEREMAKQKRHIPIRQLVLRAGKALQGLKPCFMMGPMSVAQYLEPGGLEFDLVVMDEASQMRPEEALGAVARGGQLVIVGDPKQLPPTNFFQRVLGADDDDGDADEATALEEADSILDAAMSPFAPARRLRWHYRSRDERLIAFSNQAFYDSDLVVFPAVHPGDPAYGIRFHRVANGLLNNRRNLVEAGEVVARAIAHMKVHRDESLGIVAMNIDQRELIEEVFDKKAAVDPAVQAYVDRFAKDPEPFFIKNLENVQGDERDVIFISFTYGPREHGGRVYQQFTSITSQTGWRRLNVLFTRAKKRIEVFASMTFDDIRTTPTSSKGLIALKDYLHYAATGSLGIPTETGREPDSEFEIAVADELRRHGLDCVAQLGVSDYFIDIAVRHPNVPGGYVLAIECDGAMYHSGKSVRDRDRLRQMVLEDRGWEVHRIWSTDWFRDPDGQIQVVLKKIERLLERRVLFEQVSPPGEEESAPSAELDLSVEARPAATATGGRISKEEARRQLVELRENVIKLEMPNVSPTEGFLRKSLLDALLDKLPIDMEEFRQRIPLGLRDTTNAEQVGRYRDRVFAVLKELRGV